MKEIKFRVWDKAQNKMYLWENFRMKVNNGGWEIIPNDNQPTKRDRFEIMQYTGLNDKNGKEIYEGDIVKTDHFQESNIIIWGFHSDHSSYMYQLGWNLWEDVIYEVLGNIYENPELIKASQ